MGICEQVRPASVGPSETMDLMEHLALCERRTPDLMLIRDGLMTMMYLPCTQHHCNLPKVAL